MELTLTGFRDPCARRFGHRVLAGVRFAETDGALLYVYSKDEESAAEIEDDFSLLIGDIASLILKREVGLVVVLPKVLH